jgi:hypothetical protein
VLPISHHAVLKIFAGGGPEHLRFCGVDDGDVINMKILHLK